MAREGTTRNRLTDRQAAVLAAVERLGRPTMLDLRDEFPGLAPSAVHSVLEALRKKGLVDSSGDPSQRYLGGVKYWSTAISPKEPPAPVVALMELVRRADTGLDCWTDPDARVVVFLLPLSDLARDLRGQPSPDVATLRTLLKEIESGSQPDGLRISTMVTTDSRHGSALRLELSPASE